MIESINVIFEFLNQYGILGLFISSFIGSTIFIPLTPEILLSALVAIGMNKFFLIFVASFGSLLGNLVNYFIGRIGIKYYLQKIKKEKADRKLNKLASKYGIFGFFLILALPIPLPADIFTVAAGISKMELKYFIPVVFVAKVIKYAFYAFIAGVVA